MINSIFLPNELFYIILSTCDGFERENMRLVCKLFNDFVFDTKTDYPEKYREVREIKSIKKLFEYNHKDLIKIYAKNHPSKADIILRYGCEYGMNDIVEFMIEKAVPTNRIFPSLDRNNGMSGACRSGHIDIVKLMIENGANDWNWGMYNACCGGHINIVKFMIKNGANAWNDGMSGACCGGHIDIVKFMIKNGANAWNGGMFGACRGGHIDIVKFMIKNGANAWNWGLRNACYYKHIDLVKLMIEEALVHGSPLSDNDVNAAMNSWNGHDLFTKKA